jgi:hypothetical protein
VADRKRGFVQFSGYQRIRCVCANVCVQLVRYLLDLCDRYAEGHVAYKVKICSYMQWSPAEILTTTGTWSAAI